MDVWKTVECVIIPVAAEQFAAEYNRILREQDSGYLMVVDEDDLLPSHYASTLLAAFETEDEPPVYVTGQKSFSWMGKQYASRVLSAKEVFPLGQFTDILAGTIVDISRTQDLRLNEALPYDQEADFLLRLRLLGPIQVVNSKKYRYTRPDAGQYQCYPGVYDRAWYFDSITDFLLPLLDGAQKKRGEIPLFLQYYAMHAIACRFIANENNRNKHVLSKNDFDDYQTLLRQVLLRLSDKVIMNLHDWGGYSKSYQFNRMFLRMKYSVPFLDLRFLSERTTLGLEYGGNLIYLLNKMAVNIQFMDFVDGALEIDGSVPDAFDPEKVSYYFILDQERIPVRFCERYSLTKFFGLSAYKRYSFHATVPLRETEQKLQFAVMYEGIEYTVNYEYNSHTSRLVNFPYNSYWHFGRFLATRNKNTIFIRQYRWKDMAIKELKAWKELLTRARPVFFLLRLGYVLTRPFFKNKKIWMFYDKIYKGGDSSEYLYKYAVKKHDGIRKYYLLDKNAVDYARLKREGFKPLKRGSILHRLVFLNADMMIVSNSTVFAFNDYHMENSRYIRGFPDFHVVCVQHGLSVQKIALAQQRLRDNTRLYFCASKYEIENLSRPVYDYVGYDALKLTGVPRYDGLVNRDKKQILISPTWRMQSAMLVLKNEGVARDYNPYFKETDYFRVYNSLINDERLIRAAETYGYKIVYVLHPIVSPQAGDFDTNPYVQIIPSTGEMSYEDLFCESSLMVTDYSGVQFDFAYLRKPLIYHHHRDLEAHYEEGTYHYDTMAFGEITKDNDELVSLLCEYMKNGCVMKDVYRKRADDFFAFDDRNNCQRIYDIMIDYQHNIIDKRRKEAETPPTPPPPDTQRNTNLTEKTSSQTSLAGNLSKGSAIPTKPAACFVSHPARLAETTENRLICAPADRALQTSPCCAPQRLKRENQLDARLRGGGYKPPAPRGANELAAGPCRRGQCPLIRNED